MKSCTYCGRESRDEAASCHECGKVFPISELIALPQSGSELPAPRLIDPEAIGKAFIIDSGFNRADWELVRSWIDSNISEADCEAAWNEAVILWAGKLRDDLGGRYYIIQSPQTILLCDVDLRSANWLLGYAGGAAITIRDYLGETAWQGAVGKDLVLIFSDLDDYYQYLAYHSPDGEQAQSGGVCIHSGYTHIALPWQDETDAANAIIHEITHGCLAHLTRLPLWLNEGVAMTLQRAVAPRQRGVGESAQDGLLTAAINWKPPMMWQELAERHFDFWTPDNIQSFWAGTSFYQPGESNELSYNLAEVLLKLLAERGKPPAFRGFIESARYEDAGQSAAMEILQADLGEIAGTFLGKGNWRPDRRKIADTWATAGWTREREEEIS